MADKDGSDFIRELHLVNPSTTRRLPYYEIVEENEVLKNDLYQEFLQTQKKPCEHLYLDSKGFTDEYIQMGLEERYSKKRNVQNNGSKMMAYFLADSQFETKLFELRNEFYQLVGEEKLPERYLCHDLEKTPIVQMMRDIGRQMDTFQQRAVNEHHTDGYGEMAKRFASIILMKLNGLGNVIFKNEMLKHLYENNDNVHAKVVGMFGGDSSGAEIRYQELKDAFNLHLEKPTPNLFISKTTKQRVNDYLHPLSGSWDKGKKLSKHDFETLVTNTVFLIENKKLPAILPTIGRSNFPNQFIVRIFFVIFTEFFGKKNPELRVMFIDFLHQSFFQIGQSEKSTTLKKFAGYKGNYQTDLELIEYN
jgi:hypothetical protein